MTTILDLDFSDDVSDFTGTGVTHSTAEGADFNPGVAVLTGNNGSDRAVLTFTEQTSGRSVVTLWLKVVDTTTAASGAEDTFVYLFPSSVNANTGGSANSATAIAIVRNSGSGATAGLFRFTHRDNVTFDNGMISPRDWVKVQIDIDHTNNTYDWYQEGRLITKGQNCANGSGNFNKLVFLNQTANSTVHFSRITVETDSVGLSPSTNLILEHDFSAEADAELEATTPGTDDRSLHPQPWKIPDDTASFGAFSVSGGNVVADANKLCGALVRATPEGAAELDWTEAASGTRGMGLIFRVWAGLDADSYLLLEYKSDRTAGQQLQLRQGSTVLQQSAGTTGGVSYSAGSSHTFRVEYRGRYLQAYVDGQLQLSHTMTGAGTGGRGQLSEDHIGFRLDTRTANDNMSTGNTVQAIRGYGDQIAANSGTNSDEPQRVIHSYSGITYAIESEGLFELYDSGNTTPTRNLVWSKGMQFAHLSEADPNKYASRFRSIYYSTAVKAFLYATHNLREDAFLGYSTLTYCTLTPRGIWVRERLIDNSGGRNYAPDHDLRTELWSDEFSSSARTAAGTTGNADIDKNFASWETTFSASDFITTQPVTLDGNNLLTIFSGQRGGDLPADKHRFVHKRLGNMDPLSLAHDYAAADLTTGDELILSRLLMLDRGTASQSQTFRDALNADLAQPAALTVGGDASLVTDADGDADTDGFNERHGWYEIDMADGDSATITFDNVTDRVRPQFHLANCPNIKSVSVGGTPQGGWTSVSDGNGGRVLTFSRTLAQDAALSIVATDATSTLYPSIYG